MRRRAKIAVGAVSLLVGGGGVALALPQQQGSVDLLHQAQVQWEGPGEAQGGSQTGASIVGLGDVFHSGRAALAIGAPEADPSGRLGAGSVYLVRGQGGSGSVDLTSLTGRGYRIDGAAPGDEFGFAVTSIKLANGDPGLAVGAPYASPGGRFQAGIVYVFDLARLHSDIDLSAARPGRALVGEMTGPGPCAESGYALAGAGFSSLGVAENLLVGSPGADPQGCPNDSPRGPSGGNAGAAFLVYGPRGVSRHIDLAAAGNAISTFRGAASGDRAGSAVSSAGAPSSFMIGSPYATALGRVGAGQVYLLHRALPAGVYSLASLPRGSTTFEGPAADDALGYALTSTTGFAPGARPSVPQLVMGAPQGSPRGRIHAGSVFVVREASEPAVVDLKSIEARGSPGGQIDGADAGDEAGSALADVGDVNGDGRSDLAIGAPYLNSRTGQDRIDNGGVYVLFGGLGPTTLDLANLHSRGYVAFGARDDDEAGTAVAGGVDINGDGRPDVLIGAPYGENTLAAAPQEGGDAYLLLGTGAPLLRYASTAWALRTGDRVSLVAHARTTGGASFSVSPALPAGLSLNRRTGTISGVARRRATTTLYAIQLSDLAGVAEVSLSITVAPR